MTMTPFTELIPEVALSAQGCPDFVMESYIRKAARRACERTQYWRAVLPLIHLTPGVWAYDFTTAPEGSEVHTLMSATMNGVPLPILPPYVFTCVFPEWTGTGTADATITASFEDAIYNIPHYDDSTLYNSILGAVTRVIDIQSGSEPKAIGRITPCDFIVLPKPGAGTVFSVRPFVILKPKKDAAGMEDCILDDLAEVIVHGALQELLMIPGAKWTDRDLGTYHAKQFSFKISERRARSNLGFSRGALVAHPQPFGV